MKNSITIKVKLKIIMSKYNQVEMIINPLNYKSDDHQSEDYNK